MIIKSKMCGVLNDMVGIIACDWGGINRILLKEKQCMHAVICLLIFCRELLLGELYK